VYRIYLETYASNLKSVALTVL